ncbi:MAG: hypothetical protein M1831_007569 [Alyxoria varia]|nr:MAG: hypothetical protein M1831_007569 [Alyxoria varia]
MAGCSLSSSNQSDGVYAHVSVGHRSVSNKFSKLAKVKRYPIPPDTTSSRVAGYVTRNTLRIPFSFIRAQDAIWEHAQVTADVDFLKSQLQGMIDMFGVWDVTRDSQTGLYHRTPLLDAQEFSLPGYFVGGPEGGRVEQWNNIENNYTTIDLGPETYRVSLNAYMVAAARTISNVASLAGEPSLAREWNSTASELLSRMQRQLYDSDLNFWIDVIQGSNLRVVGRQMIGYYPYRFGIGTSDENIRGLEAGLDEEHFLSEFGPTTLEKTSPYYTDLKNLTYCCLWQGQSWPFSTSIYLHTLSDIARNNRSSLVTPNFFRKAFDTYTRTNYLGDRPYTAEVHYPTIDAWSGDTANHSENYLHSTYMDNIFTDLLGIVPTLEDQFEMQPLVPPDWSHWAVENIPYHGHLLGLLYDRDGSHYPNQQHRPGFSLYSDSKLIHHSPSIPQHLRVPLTSSNRQPPAAPYINILANPNAPHSLPNASASYTLSPNADSATSFDAWKMIDTLLWYDITPDNRWTANQSSDPSTSVYLTLPRPHTFSSLSLAVISDQAQNGLLDCPESIIIKNNRTSSTLASRNPWTSCEPNALNTIAFDDGQVTTDALTITFLQKRSLSYAISELQIWVPAPTGPRYEAEDALHGTFIGGFEGRFAGGNVTLVSPSVRGGGGNASGDWDGGALLGPRGWIEWAGVYPPDDGNAGPRKLTLVGAGRGTVHVGANFLKNSTVEFTGKARLPVSTTEGELADGVQANGSSGARENVTVDGVEFLRGGNVLTVFQVEGRPFIDAVVVH